MVTRWHLLQREALHPGLYSHSLHVRRGSSTSDNLNQLSGNDSLSGTVEKNLVLVDHLTGVLGSVIHSVSSGGLLAGVALGKSPVERVGKTVLSEVAKNLIVNLESGEVGGLLDSLLRKCLNHVRLVGLGVDEAVVQNLDVGVLSRELDDLVGDSLGVGEGGNALANTREAELDGLGVGSGKLGLGLLADEDEVEARLISMESADVSGQTRVNTTAKTLVGRADDDEGLLLLGLESLGLSRLVNLVGGLSVLAGVVHGALSSGELGGGDNLHGFCDLLDVSDGLETVLDLTESRIGGSGAGDGGGPSVSCGGSSKSWSGGSRQHRD
jgi:hypothetical protein